MKKLLILSFLLLAFVYNGLSFNVVFEDATIYLNQEGIAVLDKSFVKIEGIENNPNVSYSLDRVLFTKEEIGDNWVTLTVINDDNSKMYYTSIITVLDTMKPVVNCKDATVYIDESGFAKIDETILNNGVSDNSSIKSIKLDHIEFNKDDIGGNWVTMTVKDVYGNVTYCTSIVTVLDTLMQENNNLSSDLQLSKESHIIFIPTAFTPNNDGINDVFKPFVNEELINNYEFTIYSLRNEILFKSNSSLEVWDGKFNGVDVPKGNYVWTLTTSSDFDSNLKSQKGLIKLIR